MKIWHRVNRTMACTGAWKAGGKIGRCSSGLGCNQPSKPGEAWRVCQAWHVAGGVEDPTPGIRRAEG